MDDRQIIDRIHQLVDEEDALHERRDRMTEDERQRVENIEVALDQCWDLLRQRRARREFNENPEDADLRDSDTVERYVQ